MCSCVATVVGGWPYMYSCVATVVGWPYKYSCVATVVGGWNTLVQTMLYHFCFCLFVCLLLFSFH